MVLFFSLYAAVAAHPPPLLTLTPLSVISYVAHISITATLCAPQSFVLLVSLFLLLPLQPYFSYWLTAPPPSLLTSTPLSLTAAAPSLHLSLAVAAHTPPPLTADDPLSVVTAAVTPLLPVTVSTSAQLTVLNPVNETNLWAIFFWEILWCHTPNWTQGNALDTCSSQTKAMK